MAKLHTSANVSKRQQTSAYVSIRQNLAKEAAGAIGVAKLSPVPSPPCQQQSVC
jgi:hypothetical protein